MFAFRFAGLVFKFSYGVAIDTFAGTVADTVGGDFHGMFMQFCEVLRNFVTKNANVFNRSVAQPGSASVWGTDYKSCKPLIFHG
jgi:hypothetical protein